MLNRVLTIAALCLCSSITVRSQVSTPAAQQGQSIATQEMSPERRALAKEFVDAINVRKSATDIFQIMQDQMQKQMVETTWEVLSQMKEMKELSEVEQQDLREKIRQNAEKKNKRFLDLLNQRIDLAQLTEDLSIRLYGKYFSEKELKDLIAFYKSDTGKRSMEIAPTLLAESMSQASERLTPVMSGIIRDLSSEDTNEFRNEVASLARSHHKKVAPKTRRQPGRKA
jgi:uncharacterized protein